MANILALFGVKSVVAAGSVAAVATGAVVVYQDEIAKLFQPDSISIQQPLVNEQAKVKVEPGETKKPEVKKQPEAVPAPKAAELVTIEPKFDILRVEKDGSMLIAGNAAPNAKVDVISADGTVIVSTNAGPTGDFVALPDNPLAPGDYVLSLRADQGDGKSVLSSQTSLVTVPEAGGELLAMISEEGQASRIISKPKVLEAKQPAKPVVEVAADPVVEKAPAKTVEAEPAKQAVSDIKSATSAEPKPVEVAKIETTLEKIEPQPEKLEIQPKKVEIVVKEPVKQVAALEPELQQPANVSVQPTDVIELPKPQPIPAAPQVVVEAVEMEGGQIFIAGSIPSGVPVRIYVDNKFIGLARGTSDNRFLVSKPFDLDEGEHSVRADVIDSTNGSVLARAIVPLVHEIPNELEPTPPTATVVATVTAPRVPDKVEQPVEVAALEPPKPAMVEPKAADPPPKRVEQQVTVAPKVAEPKVETTELVKLEPTVEVAASPPTPKSSEPSPSPSPQTSPPPRMPKVLKTGRAVIIKRGDNLWRISRKTYGRGIRYTTIYNANRNQIADPHRIFIGQIFKIPQKPEQEG